MIQLYPGNAVDVPSKVISIGGQATTGNVTRIVLGLGLRDPHIKNYGKRDEYLEFLVPNSLDKWELENGVFQQDIYKNGKPVLRLLKFPVIFDWATIVF